MLRSDHQAAYAADAPHNDPTPLELSQHARSRGRPAENISQHADSTNELSQKSRSPVDKTGVALLTSAVGKSTFVYYSTEYGLVESQYKTGLSANASATPVKIANNAKPTSPIAAVGGPPGLSLYRTVFYFDNDNLLNFVNTTLNSDWSEPYIVFEDMIAEPNTRALSAIAGSCGNDALSGIRVYFGSSNGTIQEVGIYFGEAIGENLVGQWYKWNTFSGTDPKSGVASVLYVWSYAENSTKWDDGVDASETDRVIEGGSIAATSVGEGPDFIFYHAADGTAVGALCPPGASCLNFASRLKALAQAPVGYSIAATGDGGTALVVNQDELKASNILFTSVTLGGASDGTILST
ncbi:hypothetical protein CB0940_06755 [Cercospora beticola]|uniref:Uncharacterized protein n=1 Tax=Cercospora beticola TaxID=122368 RepID=A0A2G5H9S7_CERBT|nr:hypothetical protein CB0940_06755 [Cercospora beticola]PIA89290.1 hypothetical protein CB0940_06755 [Cercospora beticola]WPB02667.1 hypothetical protein RHO25_007303 [Cercospora beticola]